MCLKLHWLTDGQGMVWSEGNVEEVFDMSLC